MPRSSKAARALALATAVAGAGVLAGCSEYLDRRDTISVTGGDAVNTNKVTLMVDPWPPASADKNIAFNGDTMEAAFTRYRTGKVVQPRGMDTSASYTAPSAPAPNNTTPVGPTVTQPAAPVK
jgi:hypothetical protein